MRSAGSQAVGGWPVPRRTGSPRRLSALVIVVTAISSSGILIGRHDEPDVRTVAAQVRPCWHAPAAFEVAALPTVDLEVRMNPDRTVRSAAVVDGARMQADRIYRGAAESALRAVLDPRCSPLRLPLDKFDTWKTFTISFNPKDMLS